VNEIIKRQIAEGRVSHTVFWFQYSFTVGAALESDDGDKLRKVMDVGKKIKFGHLASRSLRLCHAEQSCFGGQFSPKQVLSAGWTVCIATIKWLPQSGERVSAFGINSNKPVSLHR
jgi:hypothetical protein